MPTIKPKKMIETLIHKFQFDCEDSHHKMFVLRLDGREYVRTKISHAQGKDIFGNVLGQVARQMAVNQHELLEMVNCTKDRDWYYQKIRQRE